jgi:UDP-glucose 4-epimerase
MKWLVTGGAGYIGSHVAHLLEEENNEVTVIDNLSSGLRNRLSANTHFIEADIRDERVIQKIFLDNRFEGVMHLAALKSPEESVKNPEIYDQVNRQGTLNVISNSVARGINYIVQSSSSSIYGDASKNELAETIFPQPVSPYGKSKLDGEVALNKSVDSKLILGTSLRFFNVVGALKTNLKDTSSFNLFPKVIRAIQSNQAPVIFGRTFDTRDGTCIRDYVHAGDVARAHLQVAKYLIAGNYVPKALNIGTGRGSSVLEIVSEFLQHMDSTLTPRYEPPREGDPAVVIANCNLAAESINFTSKFELSDMVESSF